MLCVWKMCSWIGFTSFRFKDLLSKIAYEQSQKSIRQEASSGEHVHLTAMDGLRRPSSVFSSRDNQERNERPNSKQHLIFLHNTNTWTAIQDTRIMRIIKDIKDSEEKLHVNDDFEYWDLLEPWASTSILRLSLYQRKLGRCKAIRLIY